MHKNIIHKTYCILTEKNSHMKIHSHTDTKTAQTDQLTEKETHSHTESGRHKNIKHTNIL